MPEQLYPPIDVIGKLPAGRPSRRLPKPFRRDSIDLGHGAGGRSWRTVPASHLRRGDTVPGVGTVAEVHYPRQAGDPVGVFGGDMIYKRFAADEPVFAFVPDA